LIATVYSEVQLLFVSYWRDCIQEPKFCARRSMPLVFKLPLWKHAATRIWSAVVHSQLLSWCMGILAETLAENTLKGEHILLLSCT